MGQLELFVLCDQVGYLVVEQLLALAEHRVGGRYLGVGPFPDPVDEVQMPDYFLCRGHASLVFVVAFPGSLLGDGLCNGLDQGHRLGMMPFCVLSRQNPVHGWFQLELLGLLFHRLGYSLGFLIGFKGYVVIWASSLFRRS